MKSVRRENPSRQPDLNKAEQRLQMLDKDLKKHKKDLEVAINEALTESPEIAGAIQKIRQQGFDVFLIIEATIGFNKREAGALSVGELPAVRLELTTQDEKFLRSLKISPE